MINSKKNSYKDLTFQVKNWWSKNPFTYAKEDGVGIKVNYDLAFFEKCESKFRRHGVAYQKPGDPLMSNFINFKDLVGKKILDIAIGTGVTLVEFCRQGAIATGIDITDTAVDMSKENLKLRKLDGTVLQMDAQDMSFKNNEFNFVCAHGCLMHMPNMQKAVDEIYRILKPHGKVHAWVYHKGWYYWFNVLFIRGILQGYLFRYKFNLLKMTSRFSDGASNNGNPHTKFLSLKEAKEYFKKSGFKNINAYIVYNEIEFNSFPSKRFSIGRFMSEKLKQRIGKNTGLGLVISAVKI